MGQSRGKKSKAEERRAEQNEAERRKAESKQRKESRAEQCKVKESRVEQCKVKESRVEQCKGKPRLASPLDGQASGIARAGVTGRRDDPDATLRLLRIAASCRRDPDPEPDVMSSRGSDRRCRSGCLQDRRGRRSRDRRDRGPSPRVRHQVQQDARPRSLVPLSSRRAGRDGSSGALRAASRSAGAPAACHAPPTSL